MNRRITAAAVTGLALLMIGLALALRVPSPAPSSDAVQPAATELPLPLPPSAGQARDTGWRVGIYEGHVAVFSSGSEMPEQVLETTVLSLPEADREALARGIFAADRETLAALLEDYDN